MRLRAATQRAPRGWAYGSNSGSTSLRGSSAFTLIEIMIVVSILLIIVSVGVPSVMRGLQRDDLSRAMNDTIEGCKTARDRAILQGVPYEFTLSADGNMNVHALPLEPNESFVPDIRPSSAGAESAGPYAGFPRHLGEDVVIQMVDVNFLSQMDAPQASVRFFPNGTCDEFAVVYNWKGRQRTATADIVTGQVSEFIRE